MFLDRPAVHFFTTQSRYVCPLSIANMPPSFDSFPMSQKYPTTGGASYFIVSTHRRPKK